MEERMNYLIVTRAWIWMDSQFCLHTWRCSSIGTYISIQNCESTISVCL